MTDKPEGIVSQLTELATNDQEIHHYREPAEQVHYMGLIRNHDFTGTVDIVWKWTPHDPLKRVQIPTEHVLQGTLGPYHELPREIATIAVAKLVKLRVMYDFKQLMLRMEK